MNPVEKGEVVIPYAKLGVHPCPTHPVRVCSLRLGGELRFVACLDGFLVCTSSTWQLFM